MLAFRMSTTEQGMSFNVNIKAVEGIKKSICPQQYCQKNIFLYFLSFQ